MKKRIISDVFFIVIFLLFLFLGKTPFSIFMSVLAVLSVRELINLRSTKEKRIPVEIELLTYVLAILFTLNNLSFNSDYYLIDYRLIGATALIFFLPIIVINDKRVYSLTDAAYLIGITFFIGIIYNLIIQYRSYNINYVLLMLIISFSTDIFEHITDHYVGKYMFMPFVTQNKTYEGVFGGILIGTFISSMFYLSFIDIVIPPYFVFLITLMLAALSFIGRLIFIYIKNEFNKKKFSNIILGNSGILDMMDSMIFVTFGLLIFVSLI